MGTATVFVVMTAWYLISLPPIVASLLLLDRVEAQRAILGVGLWLLIILMALFCASEFQNEDVPQPGSRRWQVLQAPTSASSGSSPER